MFASHISNSIMRALRLSAPGVPEALLHKRLLAFPPPAARSLLIKGAKMACLPEREIALSVKLNQRWSTPR